MTDGIQEDRIEFLRRLLREEAGPNSLDGLAQLGDGPASAADPEAMKRALATLEAVFLVAAADGKLLRAEIDHLNESVTRLVERPLAAQHIERLVDVFAEDLDRDDYEARVRAIAATLGDEWSRRAAFVLAVGVAHVDGEVQDEEQDVIDLLAREFALKDGVVARILARAKERPA